MVRASGPFDLESTRHEDRGEDKDKLWCCMADHNMVRILNSLRRFIWAELILRIGRESTSFGVITGLPFGKITGHDIEDLRFEHFISIFRNTNGMVCRTGVQPL